MKIRIEDLKQKQGLLMKVDMGVNDKLTHAVKRNLHRIERAIKPALDDVVESTQDYSISHASVDEKGVLLVDGDKHCFTPEAKRAVMRYVSEGNKRFGETAVDFEPYLISDMNAPGFERTTGIFDMYDVEELTGILF